MPQREDAQLTDKAAAPAVALAVAPSGAAPAGPLPICTCDEFRRHKVCDHVLMAAAVRMVRRMIVIHTDSDKPH